MVLNATFNNISVISWRSVLLVEETGVPVYFINIHAIALKVIVYVCTIVHGL
jgi:hypothetical protein